MDHPSHTRPAECGRSHPLGATPNPGGVNFSLYSRHASSVELVLFDGPEDPAPMRVLALDPHLNRTFHYWHVLVPEAGPGQVYGWRVRGPRSPAKGLRFDPEKLLLDPYGRAVVVPAAYDRQAACAPGDTTATAMRSVVVDVRSYDWEGDAPLRHPSEQTVIYEMHVRGFTRHPSSGVDPARRGSYLGLVDKIPYLVDLGVTAVELMPIFQYDPFEAPPGHRNYWGYNPVSFFAPHVGYAVGRHPLAPLDEFRDMVKALHRAGIEVILDVVYNHTAEGDHTGPTLSLRGIDNPTYYLLDTDRTRYTDFTGCGNTLNANHAVVRRMILDSLRYWVEVMHVDGFRFDLASILSRDEQGRPLPSPPVLWDIETHPVLAGTKLIAEAWDAAGLYQVGTFIGDHWKEWNGRFRDDVRAFLRGDPGTTASVAARFVGSPDIYGAEQREPEQSVNFVTCHDGFTLNDLVSFERKHNEANGQDNRDGAEHNLSANHGVEGATDDPEVDAIRLRKIKSFHAVNLLALGVPMVLMGDEVRRTQNGNNNAWVQDNETSWFDWGLVARHAELHRFVRGLIRLRLHLSDAEDWRDLTLSELIQASRLEWHGVRLGRPDWGWHSHSLAVSATGRRHRFHVLLNGWTEPLTFELPPIGRSGSNAWRRVVDTARPAPDDLVDPAEAPTVTGTNYRAAPHSLVLLVATRGRR